jgi:hypothetical protein
MLFLTREWLDRLAVDWAIFVFYDTQKKTVTLMGIHKRSFSFYNEEKW